VSAPIEPLHKSVYDFLQDDTRAKQFAVTAADGHAVLALSCLRIWRENNWLAAETENTFENDLTGAQLYAKEFVAMHLAHCVQLGGLCKAAEQTWLTELTIIAVSSVVRILFTKTGNVLHGLGVYTFAVEYFDRALGCHSEESTERADLLISLCDSASCALDSARALQAAKEAGRILQTLGEGGSSLKMARLWVTMARFLGFFWEVRPTVWSTLKRHLLFS
jgi:hypothetical protein